MKGRLIMNLTIAQRATMEYLGKDWKIVGESAGMPVVSNGRAFFAISPKNPDNADAAGACMYAFKGKNPPISV